jgi:hypothetical protein
MYMRSSKYNLLIYTKAERCRIMHASSAMYIRLLAPKTSVELYKEAFVEMEKRKDTTIRYIRSKRLRESLQCAQPMSRDEGRGPVCG